MLDACVGLAPAGGRQRQPHAAADSRRTSRRASRRPFRVRCRPPRRRPGTAPRPSHYQNAAWTSSASATPRTRPRPGRGSRPRAAARTTTATTTRHRPTPTRSPRRRFGSSAASCSSPCSSAAFVSCARRGGGKNDAVLGRGGVPRGRLLDAARRRRRAADSEVIWISVRA